MPRSSIKKKMSARSRHMCIAEARRHCPARDMSLKRMRKHVRQAVVSA